MMSSRLTIKSIVVLLFLPLMASCGPLIEFPGSGDAPRHFQLTPSELTSPAKLSVSPLAIYVEEVSASGVLKTTNILVQAGANELQYYEGALWVDRTPTLIGRFLTQSLATDPSLSVIAHDNIEIPAEYRLKIDLRSFSLVTGGRSQVHVELAVMLVRNGPVEIISSKNFTVKTPVGNTQIDTVVGGFEAALDDASQQMLNWVHASINK